MQKRRIQPLKLGQFSRHCFLRASGFRSKPSRPRCSSPHPRHHSPIPSQPPSQPQSPSAGASPLDLMTTAPISHPPHQQQPPQPREEQRQRQQDEQRRKLQQSQPYQYQQHQHSHSQDSALAPTKASLKTWWNHFTFAQRLKKEVDEKKGACPTSLRLTCLPLLCMRGGGGIYDRVRWD